MREGLDRDLQHFADVTEMCFGADCASLAGSGAAGGLGYAFLAYLEADLCPGIDLVMDAVKMDKAMRDADWYSPEKDGWTIRLPWAKPLQESRVLQKNTGQK